MKILAAYNIKGGVGKTAAAVNLAYQAANTGANTLVWDLDPQGASSFYFRIKPKVKGGGKNLVRGRSELDALIKGTDYEYLDLLPADFSFRHLDVLLKNEKNPALRFSKLLKPLRKEYEYIFLDCPPGISLLSECVIEAADALVIPVIPTTLAERTLDQIVQFIGKKVVRKPVLLPFCSMVDKRKKLHREMVDLLPEDYPDLLTTAIPYASDIEQMGLHRGAVGSFAGSRRSALAYAELWSEIRRRLKKTVHGNP